MSKKTEMVVEVMNIYDENELLKNRIKELEAMQNEPILAVETKEMSNVEKQIFYLGKKNLIDKCIRSWKECHAEYDDNNEIKVTTYEKWLKDKIYNDEIPKNIAWQQFADYFEDDLKAIYDEEKKKAIESLENE